MIVITIPLDPVSWAVPRLSRHGCYDPREKDKRAIRWLIRQQYDDPPISDYVSLFFEFVFKPPASATKKAKQQMLDRHIIPTRSDCTNLQKLYEDCLKKIVIIDDRIVEEITSVKRYGEKPQVTIKILRREEYFNRLSHANCN